MWFYKVLEVKSDIPQRYFPKFTKFRDRKFFLKNHDPIAFLHRLSEVIRVYQIFFLGVFRNRTFSHLISTPLGPLSESLAFLD